MLWDTSRTLDARFIPSQLGSLTGRSADAGRGSHRSVDWRRRIKEEAAALGERGQRSKLWHPSGRPMAFSGQAYVMGSLSMIPSKQNPSTPGERDETF
jgi:hypothetical protein